MNWPLPSKKKAYVQKDPRFHEKGDYSYRSTDIDYIKLYVLYLGIYDLTLHAKTKKKKKKKKKKKEKKTPAKYRLSLTKLVTFVENTFNNEVIYYTCPTNYLYTLRLNVLTFFFDTWKLTALRHTRRENACKKYHRFLQQIYVLTNDNCVFGIELLS